MSNKWLYRFSRVTSSKWWILFFTALCIYWLVHAKNNDMEFFSAAIQLFFLGGWIGALINSNFTSAWKGMYKSQRRFNRMCDKLRGGIHNNEIEQMQKQIDYLKRELVKEISTKGS